MLDVYKITSVLEKLPDTALQQYAAMHKQDPYVLSLAVEESNRRKRIRSAPQGQQQGEQPPVNEQAVQAMAPEDTGIAQLPTGDMDFADGGIVAFANAGSVTDAMLVQREQDEMAMGRRTSFSPKAQAILARMAAERATSQSQYMQREQQSAIGHGREAAQSYRNMFQLADTESSAAAPTAAPIPQPASASEATALSGETMRANRTPATAPTAPTPPERRPDERPNLAARERTSTSTAVRAPTGGISDISKFYEEARKRYDRDDPTAEARESNRTEDLAEQQRLRDEYLANKPQGEAFTRREAALKKEEEEEPAKKEKNLKMALINAGLGMMAGTNPNAFVNIGAGAMQGVKAYQEGIKDLEKTAERRQELYDKIEEARRSEKSADAKERLAMGQQVAAINRDYQAKAIDARMKMYGISHTTAAAITGFMLDREKLMIQEHGANARTMASVNSQAQTLEKTALMEIGKTLREKYTAINKRMMEGTRALTPQAQAADAAELAEVNRDMQRIDAQLRIIAKLPASEAPAAPAPTGDRPPLGSFQK